MATRQQTDATRRPPAARRQPARRAAAREPTPLHIVGIGASAGGLEACQELLRHLPADTGLGFVLVQHLDPSHASMLVDILQRVTKMPVVEAGDRMPVAQNRVHVIPPNRDMVLSGGKLRLTAPAEPRGLRMPIDTFFHSLADDAADRAVGIVLSGTGTDGTLGLGAIFGAGGLCLVQEPGSARFSGMPSSAIQAGYAHQILPAEQMPNALPQLEGDPTVEVAAGGGLPAPAPAGLDEVLSLLRKATGHDFSLYKKSTISRRLERRMAQHNLRDLPAYAACLRDHPSEYPELFRELLINVTRFFRDPQAFVALKRKIIPQLLEGKPAGYVLRIWVAGCATGEEVYSVAMVVREWMDETQRDLKVQIYGTDLDDDAIKVARTGLYAPGIAADVGPERLPRFFTKEDAGFRVTKAVREMTVFAVQSIVRDPPFTRLDLLCCRNVLIYLEPELQDRLMPMFHYALNPGGVLFLSPSESVGKHLDLFDVLDRKWKFYRSKVHLVTTRKMPPDTLPWVAERTPAAIAAAVSRPGGQELAELARRALLQSYAPAAVVTDLQGNILYVHGDTGPYLRPAPGDPSYKLVDMAREGLQLALREGMRLAATQGSPTASTPTLLAGHGARREVRLTVRPLPHPDASQGLLLVSFQAVDTEAAAEPARTTRGKVPAATRRTLELEHELLQAKENLRAMLEEQQISNEELKSTNEELQSTNEELQSTNEEMETSKEELQSVNEELVTVNSELQNKIEQMAGMQDDMKNLLDNLQLGVIFLDRQLRIRRFTREATKVYRLLAGDVGRPLSDIRNEFTGPDFLPDVQVVLDSLVPTEREARTQQGSWVLVRIQPYRTVDNVIDGAVMTFDDVTERVAAMAAQEARTLAEAIVDAVASPLLVLDAAHRVLSANRAFHEEFGGQSQGTVGEDLFALAGRQWDLPAVRALVEAPWSAGQVPESRQAEVTLAGTEGPRYALCARRILGISPRRQIVLLAISPVPVPSVAKQPTLPRHKRPATGA